LQAAQRNQRRLVSEVTARESMAELLKLLRSHMRRLEAEIAALLGSGPRGRNWTQALCSIKGVADRTVARVMAEMPEIGTLSNQAVSKLADLAPLADDSGKREGKGVVRGGVARCGLFYLWWPAWCGVTIRTLRLFIND
jgi:transposase